MRDGIPTIILCDNEGQASGSMSCSTRMRASRRRRRSPVGVLDGGFIDAGPRARPSRDFGSSPTTRSSVASGASAAPGATGPARARGITALKPGDYVVHLEHGVGIYRGIEQCSSRESTIEVAVIEYEGGDRLNVPLYRIDQIERYRSADDVAPTRRRRGSTSSVASAGRSSATRRAPRSRR